MKNYIGISRDHSGSMASLRRAATADYNNTINSIKQSAIKNSVDTIVSVARCGGNGTSSVQLESVNSSIEALRPLTEREYPTTGGTPLFDSIGELIDQLLKAPDANDPKVTFVVMAVTDGDDNNSPNWSATRLSQRIMELQKTDRWTFVFRVPNGYKRSLMRLGIPEGNIEEWQQTEAGMAASTIATASAFDGYYEGLTRGVTASKSFYTNIAAVDPAQLKAQLLDISKEVELWIVKDAKEGSTIREFVNTKLQEKVGKPAQVTGGAFYQLIKPEREVQDYKKIVIRDKKTGVIYGGAQARNILGLPQFGTVRVTPGDHGNYDVFIQSTSINRKLPTNSILLYWSQVR